MIVMPSSTRYLSRFMTGSFLQGRKSEARRCARKEAVAVRESEAPAANAQGRCVARAALAPAEEAGPRDHGGQVRTRGRATGWAGLRAAAADRV
jgi:hypothetical protein